MRSRGSTAARLAGVTSIGLFSLLLNPLFIAPVVGVAALLVRRQNRSALRGAQRENHSIHLTHISTE